MAKEFDYTTQLRRMERLADLLVPHVNRKDLHYGSSWRKRDGSQAFSVISRKWDRFEEAAKKHKYDIFELLNSDNRKESALDDVLDLMGYNFVLLDWLLYSEKIEWKDIEEICSSSKDKFEYSSNFPVPGLHPARWPKTEQENPFGFNEEEDL